MAKRIIHCCLDIEGGIRNAKDLKGYITVDGRTLMTANEVKSFLREQLAMGRPLLSIEVRDNDGHTVSRVVHKMDLADLRKRGMVEEERRGRVVKEKSNTLACDCEGCVYHDGVIRKYTLTELERLQTLPDGYTAHGATRAERIKAIGNGWTAAVIAEIFSNLR